MRQLVKSNQRPTPNSPALVEYNRLIKTGMDPKTAAKQAQFTTGIAIRSGKPMMTRGYGGWQTSLFK
jgi:hypothetical protein